MIDAELNRDSRCHDEFPEITPEMIEAGAAVLDADPWIDVGSGYAEKIAKDVLEAALRVGRENSEAD